MTGKVLADQAEQQIKEIGEFLAEVSDPDLEVPCVDEGAGDTVGTVTAHLVAGFTQAAMFLRVQMAGGLPANFDSAAADHHHHHDVGSHKKTDVETMMRTLERDGATIIKLLNKLTDEQLAVVPPKIGNLADGVKPMSAVIAATFEHQAEHLVKLRAAVAGVNAS